MTIQEQIKQFLAAPIIGYDAMLSSVVDLLEQARRTSARAIENLPKLPAWYFYRGIAEFQLEKYPEALVSYKTGLPLIASDKLDLKIDFYAQIADTYFKMSKKDSAFANYEKSLAANPKNIMVMNNYAYYLSLGKDELKKAERMSAKTGLSFRYIRV